MLNQVTQQLKILLKKLFKNNYPEFRIGSVVLRFSEKLKLSRYFYCSSSSIPQTRAVKSMHF